VYGHDAGKALEASEVFEPGLAVFKAGDEVDMDKNGKLLEAWNGEAIEHSC
jgi:hypothetical protein